MTTVVAPGADVAASAPATPAGSSHDARARRSAPSVAWLGLVPFAAYVLLFLAVPTVLAVGSGFFDGDGAFTWTNVAALGDPVRLRLFSAVASHRNGEACVCDISDVGVSQPTVSHHLKKLKEAGLLSSERRGTWVYYRVEPAVLAAMGAILTKAASV